MSNDSVTSSSAVKRHSTRIGCDTDDDNSSVSDQSSVASAKRSRPSEPAAAAGTAKKPRKAELSKALPENPFGRNKSIVKPSTLVTTNGQFT